MRELWCKTVHLLWLIQSLCKNVAQIFKKHTCALNHFNIEMKYRWLPHLALGSAVVHPQRKMSIDCVRLCAHPFLLSPLLTSPARSSLSWLTLLWAARSVSAPLLWQPLSCVFLFVHQSAFFCLYLRPKHATVEPFIPLLLFTVPVFFTYDIRNDKILDKV